MRSGSAAVSDRQTARCGFASPAMKCGSSSSAHSQFFQKAFTTRKPPAVLLRPLREFGIDAERERGVVRPVGIEERLAAERDEVGLAGLQHAFGLLRREDEAD